MPQTAAEEMALWLPIEDAENRVNEPYDFLAEDRGRSRHIRTTTPGEDCRDYLFYAHDILFLFDQTLEDSADPGQLPPGRSPMSPDYPKVMVRPILGLTSPGQRA